MVQPQVALVVKNLSANAGNSSDASSIPGLGRSPGIGNGNPFQYSCMETPMDRGAGRATVHGVTKSWTQLSVRTHTHTQTLTSSHTYKNAKFPNLTYLVSLINGNLLMFLTTYALFQNSYIFPLFFRGVGIDVTHIYSGILLSY